MIDTHSHIYLDEFDADRNDMLLRAKEAGVEKILLPNIDTDSISSMLALAKNEKEFCFPMIGLHPCSVKKDHQKQLECISDHLSSQKIKYYGIGECGLDYYWDKSLIPEQKAAFEFQILLAKKYKLPLSIHSRDATGDCIELISRHKDETLRGVFHCFTGTAEQLRQIIELDFYAGIGGVVTFKNGGLDKVLTTEHIDRLVLETDAPYLAPVPFRGKRNEPSYLTFVVEKLSELLNLSVEEVIIITRKNSMDIFKI